MAAKSNESHWFVSLGALLLLASTWFGASAPAIQGRLLGPDGTTLTGRTIVLLDEAVVDEQMVRAREPEVKRLLASAPQAISDGAGYFRIPWVELAQPVLCVLCDGTLLSWFPLDHLADHAIDGPLTLTVDTMPSVVCARPAYR